MVIFASFDAVNLLSDVPNSKLFILRWPLISIQGKEILAISTDLKGYPSILHDRRLGRSIFEVALNPRNNAATIAFTPSRPSGARRTIMR